jgi:hypothetical protein
LPMALSPELFSPLLSNLCSASICALSRSRGRINGRLMIGWRNGNEIALAGAYCGWVTLAAPADAGGELRSPGTPSVRAARAVLAVAEVEANAVADADASAGQTGKPAARGDRPWENCAGIRASVIWEATLSLMAGSVNY